MRSCHLEGVASHSASRLGIIRVKMVSPDNPVTIQLFFIFQEVGDHITL